MPRHATSSKGNLATFNDHFWRARSRRFEATCDSLVNYHFCHKAQDCQSTAARAAQLR